ncbi:MAG: hypothetical protein J6J53_06130 [Muribaculaceae bacterium]|nr:hypothetical protein [Muribaculaceae bacterium]
MSKFTTTLKGLMALALGSFALSAGAVENFVTLDNATTVTAIPGSSENNAIYVIQSQGRGGLYADMTPTPMQLTHCGTENSAWHKGDVAVNASDVNQQFAIITHNGNKYLYSLAAKAFVTYSATPDFAPDGKAVLSATSVANSGLTMEQVTDNGKTFFTLKIKGYRLNNDNDYDADTYKGVCLYNSAVDEGSRYNLQKLNGVTLSSEELAAATANIAGTLTTAKETAIGHLNNIKEFYHDPELISQEIALVRLATTEAQINAIVNSVYDSLNGKLVHFTYVPRENESTEKYLGVIEVNGYRLAVLLDEPGTRTKWKLERIPNTYNFKLKNIASDTHLGTKSDLGVMEAGSSSSVFPVRFLNNESTSNAICLTFHKNDICQTVGPLTWGGKQYQGLVWTKNTIDANAVKNVNNAWRITPVGVSETQLSSMDSNGEYFVIRNNRALTSTPNNEDAPAFPGALLGCYTPDREKARKNATNLDNGVTLSNGVHVRQFMTGMHTIWKIVPQTGGGYKIYSLMGEGENDAPLMGMTFGTDANSEVTITENPTTVYFIDPTSYDGYDANKSPLPYGVAISTTAKATEGKCFYVANALEGEDGMVATADFYVTANSETPATSTASDDQGSVFYIERVSATDVANAKAAFIDYAKNNRMFELLKNVLTDEEKAFALEEKASMSTDDITSVAKAREYLMLGKQAASTRAFEQLDGKVVRLSNRKGETETASVYLNYNEGNNENKLFTKNTNLDTDLAYLWQIEVANAPLREIRLKNYLSGKYIAPLSGQALSAVRADQTDPDKAGTYNVARYYSIDGKSFYANLLGTANTRRNNYFARNTGNNWINGSTSADLGSHWTLENAVAAGAMNTQLDLTINDKGDLISIKHAEDGSLTKTANFPAAYTVKLTPKAVATPANADATTPTEVVIPEANINPDGTGFVVNLDGLNVPEGEYTLNFPVGYFTANGKLAPALSKEVKVEDTTGIREVNAAEKGAAEVIYDLQGRRVSKASKGVYIINGVKTLVK